MANHPSWIQPSIFRIYGRPKLMELLSNNVPLCTNRLLDIPVVMIFCAVLVMYFPYRSPSPIFIQFTPVSSVVRNDFMGRGDPPRTISAIPPSRTHSQPSGNSYGCSSSGTSAAARRSSGVRSCFFFAMLSPPCLPAARRRLRRGGRRLRGGSCSRRGRSRRGRGGPRSR